MKPILFNTPMTRAIQEGRKTATRRKPFQMPSDYNELKGLCRDDKSRVFAVFQCSKDITTQAVYAPYRPGDILWVRETWRETGVISQPYAYRAAEDDLHLIGEDGQALTLRYRWRPSIHMPKEAARLFLRVTGVRVERLREISGLHAKAEGCEGFVHINPLYGCPETVHNFKKLWNSTIKPADLSLYGWEANPWVWVIEFERIIKEAALGGGGDG